MAARLNKLHQADIRQKIQASQLINVLQAHALTGEGEISPTRMKAIEILLRKSVADLSAVELTGEGGGPIEHDHTHRLPAETERFLDGLRAGAGDSISPPPVQD
jgi:hypothetical protein